MERSSEDSPMMGREAFPKRAGQKELIGRSVDDSHVEEEFSSHSMSSETSMSFDIYR